MNKPGWAVVASLLLMLTGCSVSDADSVSPSGASSQAAMSAPIAFSVSDSTARAATRTARGTIDLGVLKTKDFGVFACHTGLHPYISTNLTQDYMYNQQVSYNTSYGIWDYTPVVYWPAAVDGLYPYVSFFAYAPYAANPGTDNSPAEHCIVDFTLPVETGDPWLVYQLGGTEDDWRDDQVDLLYAFRPDCQQAETPTRIDFNFRHALACAGDKITVTCSNALQEALIDMSLSTRVTQVICLKSITLTYHLLRKGRLSLASTDTPRWQTIASETPTVERRLTLTPSLDIARVSLGRPTLTDYTATDQGIFYLPIADAANPQWVDITIEYEVNRSRSGSVTTRVNLNTVAAANANRDFRIELPFEQHLFI